MDENTKRAIKGMTEAIEKNLNDINRLLTVVIPELEQIRTSELIEFLLPKQSVESVVANLKRLSGLREFYDSYKLTKKYCSPGHKCSVCGENIHKAVCTTHTEIYEIGHKDDCPHKPIFREGCVIE